MSTNKILIRCLFFLGLAVSQVTNANQKDSTFSLPVSDNQTVVPVSCEFEGKDTIVIGNNNHIVGLAINGKVEQLYSDSYVGVFLEDINGKKYMIASFKRYFNDTEEISLSNYCEETKFLPCIIPHKIQVVVRNAKLTIQNIIYNNAEEITTTKASTLSRDDIIDEDYLVEQATAKAAAINQYNIQHNIPWIADVTDLSIMPWEQRKRALGCPLDYEDDTGGLEYYSGGIFYFSGLGIPVGIESQSLPDNISNRSLQNQNYVKSFDWRNRHGKNWLTIEKNQEDSWGSWAFASVGTVESQVNLYYNRIINMDLSEQEVISCSNCGDLLSGGNGEDALAWIAYHGISEESAFPFSNSVVDCSNKNSNYTELIRFQGVSSSSYNNIKKDLIKYGPMVSGYQYVTYTNPRGHCMVLVGFGTIEVGDTIKCVSKNFGQRNVVVDSLSNYAGKTYWVFKNNYGPNYYGDYSGYMYLVFNDDVAFIRPYRPIFPISSLCYDDSDIVCEDADGDGFYYWGLGIKPSTCPEWIPDTPDGDDSDYTKGYMDDFGNLFDIPQHILDEEIISTDTTWNTEKFLYHNILVNNNATLTITSHIHFYEGVILSLREGAKLVIDGGMLSDANISVEETSGCIIKILNNGNIKILNNGSFLITSGNQFVVDDGMLYY